MVDVFDKAKRSAVMSRIRSEGNRGTELRLIELMRAYKVTGWRRKQKIFGRPDFVFWQSRTAVFVDGCFWHGCRKCGLNPVTNAEFWSTKIAGNKMRDRKVNCELRRLGWRVVRIWGHELKNGAKVIEQLKRVLTSR